VLLEHGHSVVTTVRSEEKANKIREAYPKTPKEKLDFVIVKDIAQEGAFDEAVKIEGLEAVLHTASPFHFKWVFCVYRANLITWIDILHRISSPSCYFFQSDLWAS
jgi:hypothetical protein